MTLLLVCVFSYTLSLFVLFLLFRGAALLLSEEGRNIEVVKLHKKMAGKVGENCDLRE